MALTRRQRMLYTDTADIYSPLALNKNATTKRLETNDAGELNATPTSADVACKYWPSSEYAAAEGPMGRTLQDNMLTLDVFHFEASVSVLDGCVIHLKTVGHPDTGTYYRVQGNAETWQAAGRRKSNYGKVLCKRIPAPKELVA